MMKHILDILFGKISMAEAKKMSYLGEYKIWFKKSKHYSKTFDQVWNADHSWMFWFVTRTDSDCVQTRAKAKAFLKLKAKIEPDKFNDYIVKTIHSREPIKVKAKA